MKKFLSIVILFALLALSLCVPMTVSASETSGEMVYCSNAEREEIWQRIQTEKPSPWEELEEAGIQIVKESITPVYTIDWTALAETGEVEVKLNVTPHISGANYYSYVAKTITAEGEYGGTYIITVFDDGRVIGYFTPSPAIDHYRYDSITGKRRSNSASCSYADHAERIRLLLNKEEIVSPYDVKYVFLASQMVHPRGAYFYIESEQVFIPIGVTSASATEKDVRDFVLTPEDMRPQAEKDLEEYNAFLERKAAWEKEHPGETFLAVGGEGSPYSFSAAPVCSHLGNVNNIAEYLGIDMTTIPPENPIKAFLPWCGVACAIVLSVSTGLFYRKCRKEN